MLDTKQKPVEETNPMPTARDPTRRAPDSLSCSLEAQQHRTRLQQDKSWPQAPSGEL